MLIHLKVSVLAFECKKINCKRQKYPSLSHILHIFLGRSQDFPLPSPAAFLSQWPCPYPAELTAYSYHNSTKYKFETTKYLFWWENTKFWPVLFWVFVFAGTRNIFERKFHNLSLRKKVQHKASDHRILLWRQPQIWHQWELPMTTSPCFEHKTSEINMHCHDQSKYSRSHDLNFCNLHSFWSSLKLYQTIIFKKLLDG